ncbi:MAG: hypothetical protein MI749_14530 [Desulfovibrionales bacterium]|nr:hypothetical protein [Desulfovibrionales bacterium]
MTGINRTSSTPTVVPETERQEHGAPAKNGAMNGRTVAVVDADIPRHESTLSQMHNVCIRDRILRQGQPANLDVIATCSSELAGRSIDTTPVGRVANALTTISEPEDAPQNDGRMKPENFRRARVFVQELQAKYGSSVAWWISQKIWETPKYHAFTSSNEKSLEKTAASIHTLMMKEKSSFSKTMKKEIERFYKQQGIDTADGKLVFWVEDAVRTAIYKDGPLTASRKAAIANTLTANLANTIENPLAAPEHRGEPPLVLEPMPNGAVSLEDASQFLAALQRYASGLYESSGLGVSSKKPDVKEALAALIWQANDMHSYLADGRATEDSLNWTPLLHTIENLLAMENPVLTDHQRETLHILRERVNERALLPICNEFKETLSRQLKELGKPGTEKKLHLGFSLGAAGSLGGVADALGGELRVTFDYMFTNNDYTIDERKRLAGGFTLYAGDKKILQIAAGGEGAASSIRSYLTVDDLVNKHSNDLLAALLPLEVKNLKKAYVVREQNELQQSRAGDFEVLANRYFQQGVLTPQNSLVPVSQPEPPRYRSASSVSLSGSVSGSVASGLAEGEARASVEQYKMQEIMPLLTALERQPEKLAKGKDDYFITAGEGMRHGTVLDRSMEFKERIETIDAQLRSERDPKQLAALRDLRNVVQSEAATFAQRIAEQELATLNMYTRAVNLYDSGLDEVGSKQLHKELRTLKHSIEKAKDTNGRGEYLRAHSYVAVALGQLADVLESPEARQAVEEYRNHVEEPNIYLKPEKHRVGMLSTRLFWKSTVKRTTEEFSFKIPTTSMQIKVRSVQTSRKNMTPDRDGETLDFSLSLPTSGYIMPILSAFNTQVLERQGINVLELAKGLLPENLTASGDTSGGISALAERITDMIGADASVGSKKSRRFDLRLKKINGEWRMLYLRMMDDASKGVNVPLSAPVSPGASVTVGVEASLSDTSVKRLFLGADTLEMIKGRYDIWKDADVLDERWPQFLVQHEREIKRIVTAMADSTSNPSVEAREMIERADEIGFFADTDETAEQFTQHLDAAVQAYADDPTDKHYMEAVKQFSLLFEAHSEVYLSDMEDMIRMSIEE